MKKKILFVHHASGLGGAPKSLSFIIENLDKTKYTATVLMLWDGEVRKLFEDAGAEVLYVKRLYGFHGTTVSGINMRILYRNFTGFFPAYFEAKKILRRIDYDLIHLNTTCMFAVAKASKKVKPQVPIICHVREPLLSNVWGRVLKFFNSKYCDHFISITKEDGKPFKDNNLSVIYNCSDIDKICCRKEYNSKEQFNCLFLSRANVDNGIIVLLKAAKILYNEMNIRDIDFFIYGCPSPIENYIASLPISSPNVKFFPMTPNIETALADADVQISPYIKPHFSRAVIEAGLLGIPSIVSDVGVVQEIVVDNDTGLIFENGNHYDLANKILLLHNNKLLYQKMCNNVKIFAKKTFSVEICQEAIEKVYNTYLNPKQC